MVQRKALSKPSFKASPILEAIKKPSTNMKPSIQSLDSKARGPDLAKKMKKSWSFKRSSDLEGLKRPSSRRHHLSPLPDPPPKQQPPPCSPVKQSPPNYMKSTSSSEARKEQKQVPNKTPIKSVIQTTPKRLFSSSSSSPRLVSRTSSLEKVRTLTKAPSFKPSRSIMSVKKCSKTALCGVKRATCSSTMKETKFPSYLDLNPGGTEYEGTSVMKVCPYNYCSLNGHRHSPAPPLKSFLCARRRMMKAQRSLKPVTSSPCKVKPCLEDDQGKEGVGVGDKPAPLLFKEEEADFFVQVYVKEGEDKAEGAMEAAQSECVYEGGSFDWESSTSITLDELSAESSDMEWDKENRIYLTGMELEDGVSTPSEYESDHTKGNELVFLLDEEGLKKDDVNMEFLEHEAEEISQDEIIDCHEQSSDSEYSSTNDAYEETELDQFFQGNFDDVLVPFGADEETKADGLSALNKEITADIPVPEQADEEMEKSGFTKQASQNAELVQDDSDLKTNLLPVESINQAREATEEEDETTSVPEEDQSKEDSKPSGNVVSKEKFKKESCRGELSGACSSSLIITNGRRNRGEESEELKSFNPREPNYLEVEPDPEAEKVDLKHQEMDERRNSEEWMLDYALRKAVNELAPARKKVALLVAAFETVAPPARNCEARARRISSDFVRVQACN